MTAVSPSVTLEPNKTYPTPGDRISFVAVGSTDPFAAALVIMEGTEGHRNYKLSRYAVIGVRPGVYRLRKLRTDGGDEYYVDVSGPFPRCDCTGSHGFFCKHANAMAKHHAAGHLDPQNTG